MPAPAEKPTATWAEFAAEAPTVAATFRRRHEATGRLCLLGTLRADGWPRISPVEPALFEDALWIVGMPHTRKFDDLARDPRFTLHTATVDTHVSDGDAKVWGTVRDNADRDLHERFAVDLFAQTGFDLRGQRFDHFYEAVLSGGSTVEVGDDHLDVRIWAPGAGERVVRKH